MSSAVAEAPAAAVALGERFETIPLERIFASPTNPRTHFDDHYIAELAGSILEKGLIQPIIVRQMTAARRQSDFEIVAGECRYRASKHAKLTSVPAIIRRYTDEQVLEVQLIENLHRTDLTPLEQAVGYRRLIDTNPTKHNAETIAHRVGMSVAWVWDRLKLNDLILEAKTILEQERMTIGHAILIARLKPEDQARAIAFDDDSSSQYRGVGLWRHDSGFDFDEDDPANKGKKSGKYDTLKACSVRELEAWIRNHVRFDPTHAAKAQPLVFEQTAAKVEAAAAQPGRGKKVISITHEYRVADDARDEQERTYGSQSWFRADGQEKSKTCEHSVLGVVVAGEGYGETLEVCINREKCKVHFADVIQKREKNQKLRDAGQEKQAAKAERKAEESYQQKWKREEEERRRLAAAWAPVRERALTAVAEGLLKKGPHATLLASLQEQIYLHGNDRKLFQQVIGKVTAQNIVVALVFADIIDDDSRTPDSLSKAVKPFGIKIDAFEAEYKAALKPAAAPKATSAKKSGKKR